MKKTAFAWLFCCMAALTFGFKCKPKKSVSEFVIFQLNVSHSEKGVKSGCDLRYLYDTKTDSIYSLNDKFAHYEPFVHSHPHDSIVHLKKFQEYSRSIQIMEDFFKHNRKPIKLKNVGEYEVSIKMISIFDAKKAIVKSDIKFELFKGYEKYSKTNTCLFESFKIDNDFKQSLFASRIEKLLTVTKADEKINAVLATVCGVH